MLRKKEPLYKCERITYFITSLLLVDVYDGTLSDKVDLHEYEQNRLNYTFYGEEKPKLECFDSTKGLYYIEFTDRTSLKLDKNGPNQNRQ